MERQRYMERLGCQTTPLKRKWLGKKKIDGI
jgi:hypothetical protein